MCVGNRESEKKSALTPWRHASQVKEGPTQYEMTNALYQAFGDNIVTERERLMSSLAVSEVFTAYRAPGGV